MKRATELQWLSWFYAWADFGPADEDVREELKEQFTRQTGLALPKEYEDD